MNCLTCGGRMAVTTRTHRYLESGLPNVQLSGVEVRKCQKCGEQEVAIPNLEGLHRCIAHGLAEKASRLNGPEIRFLRKYLGRSSQDFAELIGVTRETVSRWETGKKPLSALADRVLRLMVLHGKPVEDYSLDRLKGIDEKARRAVRLDVEVWNHGWRVATA